MSSDDGDVNPVEISSGNDVEELQPTVGELVVVTESEGVLVSGDAADVDLCVTRIREVAGQAATVTAVDGALVGNAMGLVGGGASFLGQSTKFVQLHAESVKALKVGKAIPGNPGYYRMMTRGADGKFLKQLQWKSTSVNPQRLMAVQMIAVQIALTSAIAQVEEAVQRVEDKVEAVLQLAEAERAGDVIGNHETVVRMVRYLDRHGSLPDAMWESVASLGPVLAATVEQLRNHVERIVASLGPGGSVPDRARLLRRAVEQSKLKETLDLLIVAEDSLHKWHRLLVARVGAMERGHLTQVLDESRELLRHQLQEDGTLYQRAKVAIDLAAKMDDTDGFRVWSVQRLVRYRDMLREALEGFARARRQQLETWEDLEPPGLQKAVSGTVDVAIASTAHALSGVGTRLIKIGDSLLEGDRRGKVGASKPASQSENSEEATAALHVDQSRVVIVQRTHFRRAYSDQEERSLWYWTTEAADGENISVGGEGYSQLPQALNGFFATQGDTSWDTSYTGQQGMPDGYAMEKIESDRYVITKHEATHE